MITDSEQVIEKTELPLAGRRIVVTRAVEQSSSLIIRLRALGATPIECPAISIAPLHEFTRLDAAISRLETYDWVVFTSVNGVMAFTSRMEALGKQKGDLCARKLAAIGPATRAALIEAGCQPDFMPNSYVAESIVEQIGDVTGCRVLLPRADIAREMLAGGLRQKGASVDEVDAYRTVSGEGPLALKSLLQASAVDAVTFTSSSTVRYTLRGLAEAGLDETQALELLNGATIVCIGPITAQTANECGLKIAAVADEYTTDGLIEALVRVFATGNERND
jgi:uroporphyrinogen-III synthase